MNQKILKDTLILAVITLAAGLLLGFVYEITKNPIKNEQEKTKQEACKNVFSEADTFDTDHKMSVKDAVKTLEKDYPNCSIDECIKAMDSNDSGIGYVITVTTKEGYSGEITLMIGVKADGTLNGIDILAINETAGLGMKAKEPAFKTQFKNKKVSEFAVTKDTVKEPSQIQAISSATITSKAVTRAVNAGLLYFNTIKQDGGEQNE